MKKFFGETMNIPTIIKCRKCNKNMKNPASIHKGFVPAPICLNCLCQELGNMGKLKSWTKKKIELNKQEIKARKSEEKIEVYADKGYTHNKDIITLSQYI